MRTHWNIINLKTQESQSTHFWLIHCIFLKILDRFLTKPIHIFIKARFKGIQICILHVTFNLSTRTAWESYKAKALRTPNKFSQIWGSNNYFCTSILSHYILFYCRQQLRNCCDLCNEIENWHADWIIYVSFYSSFCINMYRRGIPSFVFKIKR